MRFKDFNYILPPELIAQSPAYRREDSRLLVLDRREKAIIETVFSGIDELFRPGDLLVLNDTRVIPARLFGTKETGGQVEIFLVRRLPEPGVVWTCLVRSSKRPRPGTAVLLPGGMTARVVEPYDEETWKVSFSPVEDFGGWLDAEGHMPLPPYIRRSAEPEDRGRYQTVFATNPGAVAAPTAGLHFTPTLLERITAMGVEIAPVTLHVGLGTFLPVRVERVDEHRMHREEYSVPEKTAAAIAARKSGAGRVIALGTTTARTLEHAALPDGTVCPGRGEADIFIYPGYQFRVVDAMITNFHLPCSTLLLLVAAFTGRDFLMEAYNEAVKRRFRFYSYGDAMFIH
jgi:S-adenosylmethionine:tRNA ribosyltransferase-isomerase